MTCDCRPQVTGACPLGLMWSQSSKSSQDQREERKTFLASSGFRQNNPQGIWKFSRPSSGPLHQFLHWGCILVGYLGRKTILEDAIACACSKAQATPCVQAFSAKKPVVTKVPLRHSPARSVQRQTVMILSQNDG